MHRVLVCDDERHIARLIRVKLERQGYSVKTCQNGGECLARLRGGSYDLLVLDHEIGTPSAQEVLQEIESDPSLTVKVLLLKKDAMDSFPPQEPPTGLAPVLVPFLRANR